MALAIGIYTITLSPREERVGRETERGEGQQYGLLSPALSSLLRREEREKIQETQAIADLCRYQWALAR